MKVEINVDKSKEEKIVITVKEMTEEINKIISLLSQSNTNRIVGYKSGKGV